MHLNSKQIEEILAKKPENRYKYFIKTAYAEEEIWGLADDEGWLMLEVESDNVDAIAVFPNAEFAEIFKKNGDYEEFRVESLDLYEFVDWLEDFEAEGIQVAVFPTPNMQSAVMIPQKLREDLQTEFDKDTGE